MTWISSRVHIFLHGRKCLTASMIMTCIKALFPASTDDRELLIGDDWHSKKAEVLLADFYRMYSG